MFRSTTIGIRARLCLSGAISGEEVKGSRIEKFDETDFGYRRMHLPLLGEKPESSQPRIGLYLTGKF